LTKGTGSPPLAGSDPGGEAELSLRARSSLAGCPKSPPPPPVFQTVPTQAASPPSHRPPLFCGSRAKKLKLYNLSPPSPHAPESAGSSNKKRAGSTNAGQIGAETRPSNRLPSSAVSFQACMADSAKDRSPRLAKRVGNLRGGVGSGLTGQWSLSAPCP